jgi:uncharacterized membrane protein
MGWGWRSQRGRRAGGSVHPPAGRLCLALLLGSALGAAACLPFGSEDLATIEPDAVPLHPTYAQDVEPILRQYCVACHASGALGTARAYPYYDTQSEAEAVACRTRYTAVISRNMPPGVMDRPTTEERLILDRWASDYLNGQVDCPHRERRR